MWELTREFVARGHEVSILTVGSWRTRQRRSVREGRVIYHLPYLPGRHAALLRKTLEDLSFNLAAPWWLRANGGCFERIHLQGRSGWLYAGLRAEYSTPVVTTFRRLLDIEYA